MNEYEYKKKKWDELVDNNDTTMDELELQEVYYSALMKDYKNGVLTDEPILLNYGDLAKYVMKKENLTEIKIDYAKNLPTNIKNIIEKRRQWLNNPSDSTFYEPNNRIEDAIAYFLRSRKALVSCENLFNNEETVNDVWIKLNNISTEATNKFLENFFLIPNFFYYQSNSHNRHFEIDIEKGKNIQNKLKLLEKALKEAEEEENLLLHVYNKEYNNLLNAITKFKALLKTPPKFSSKENEYSFFNRISNRESKTDKGISVYFARFISEMFRRYYSQPLNNINCSIIYSLFGKAYDENQITKFYKQIEKK